MIANFEEKDIRLKVDAINREDAIKKSAKILVDNGNITTGYIDEMLEALKDFGPYFVLTPGMAFAHAKPSKSVLQTGLSLITLKKPIIFGHEKNDPVELVCTIASIDTEDHLLLLQKIVTVLADPQKVKFILNASSRNDKKQIVETLNQVKF